MSIFSKPQAHLFLFAVLGFFPMAAWLGPDPYPDHELGPLQRRDIGRGAAGNDEVARRRRLLEKWQNLVGSALQFLADYENSLSLPADGTYDGPQTHRDGSGCSTMTPANNLDDAMFDSLDVVGTWQDPDVVRVELQCPCLRCQINRWLEERQEPVQ